MKNIILQRSIDVQCWNVLGTVAKASKRPELMPVLLRASERHQTNAEDIADHLFFEQRSRRVVAERMLRIATSYGLLSQNDRMFSLTDAGVAALNSEQVFVPERGTWTIWTTKDPLFDYPILRVDSWKEPTAYDDVQREKNKEKEKNERKFVAVPATVLDARDYVATPPCGGGGLLRIDELAQMAEENNADASLKLSWNAGQEKMSLAGKLQGVQVNTVLNAPRVAPDDVWQQLLEAEGLWSRWDRARSALLVGFEETNDRERESLLRDLAISTPTLGKLGKFDTLTIQDVQLQARTASDAESWARWRLQARLHDYTTRERFEAWVKEAIEPFASYRLTFPTRVELAKDAWPRRGDRPSPLAWHLAAAEDWSL